MLNQVILVGRITENPTIKELESGKKVSTIILKVPRTWKNAEGIYEDDCIPCILWSAVAENVVEYCKKGDLVGIKGRLQVTENKMEVVAEKVTFLSNRKEESEEA